jgi:hypothetical protein
MAVDIDIFGSVVCRDIIMHDTNMRYQVKRCLSGIPITTLYEKPIPLPAKRILSTSLSVYERRMLEIQASKKAAELLRTSEAKILLIDLADELLSRFLVTEDDKRVHLALDKKYAKELESLFIKKNKVIIVNEISPLKMEQKAIEECFRNFAIDIVKSDSNPNGYEPKNIIVIEAYYSEKIIDSYDGKLRKQLEEFDVKNSNDFLMQLYQMLYFHLPGSIAIRFPERTYTSENHLRGVTPLSYTNSTYQYYLKVLDVLSGHDKSNSIVNIYNDQVHKNRLYERLLNAEPIYSIEGMKKDIKKLQGENQKLKKEIELLKREKA